MVFDNTFLLCKFSVFVYQTTLFVLSLHLGDVGRFFEEMRFCYVSRKINDTESIFVQFNYLKFKQINEKPLFMQNKLSLPKAFQHFFFINK